MRNVQYYERFGVAGVKPTQPVLTASAAYFGVVFAAPIDEMLGNSDCAPDANVDREWIGHDLVEDGAVVATQVFETDGGTEAVRRDCPDGIDEHVGAVDEAEGADAAANGIAEAGGYAVDEAAFDAEANDIAEEGLGGVDDVVGVAAGDAFGDNGDGVGERDRREMIQVVAKHDQPRVQAQWGAEANATRRKDYEGHGADEVGAVAKRRLEWKGFDCP